MGRAIACEYFRTNGGSLLVVEDDINHTVHGVWIPKDYIKPAHYRYCATCFPTKGEK